MAAAPPPAHVVVVGAGQAGVQAALSLRDEGFAGVIDLIGAEPHPPYHRPPLSKGVVLGTTLPDQLTIRAPVALERKGIRLTTATAVTRLDLDRRLVHLDNGEQLAADRVILATGARARPLALPGVEACADRVLTLRGLDDALRLGAVADTARHAVVVGAGFVGLEVAAALRQRGLTVSVVETADRVLARVGSPALAQYLADLHHRHGVDIRCATTIAATHADGDQVRAVVDGQGGEITADLVVAGIGAIANDQLAAAAGLDCDRGVVVDELCRTAHSWVLAIGDCAVGPNGRRLESVQNAVEQARTAAATIMGRSRPFTATPWFWSDQYDVKVQMAGTHRGADSWVTRGRPDGADGFSLLHYRGATLVGVDSINRPQDHLAARRLLDQGRTPPPALAANAERPLDLPA